MKKLLSILLLSCVLSHAEDALNEVVKSTNKQMSDIQSDVVIKPDTIKAGLDAEAQVKEYEKIHHPDKLQRYLNTASQIRAKSSNVLENLTAGQRNIINGISANSRSLTEQVVNRAAAKQGIKVNDAPQLYYFISFSMPTRLIEAYLADATWNGGIIVLRGVDPKDKSLSKFLKNKIIPMVSYTGGHARIYIDPNKFEEYQVQGVPSIVLSKYNETNGCQFLDKSQKCKAAPSRDYWKIEGDVSSYYALSAFSDAGAKQAKIFLDRMTHQPYANHSAQEKPISTDKTISDYTPTVATVAPISKRCTYRPKHAVN